MPYTAMRNLAAGDLVTESDMDALRQNIDYLHLPNVAYASGTYQTIAGTASQNTAGYSAMFTWWPMNMTVSGMPEAGSGHFSTDITECTDDPMF